MGVIILVVNLVSVLSGCVAGVVGGAAVLGTSIVSAARQEGGLSEAVEDLKIAGDIGYNWLRFDARFINKFEATVREGRVLVTGVVAERGEADDAIRLVWQVPGVREVYNEIEITHKIGSVADFSRDILISTQLKNRLLFDANIASTNYDIDVTNGVVYLIGVARDRRELDRVLVLARSLKYVKRVVSYISFKNDKLLP